MLNSGITQEFEALPFLQMENAWVVLPSKAYFTSIIAVSHVPNSGRLTLKLTANPSKEHIVLFCGLSIVILGGIVPGIGSITLKIKNGLAFAFWIVLVSVTAKSRNIKAKIVVKVVFLYTSITSSFGY